MATRNVSITGTIKWAKVFEENRDMGEYHTDTDGALSVNIVADESEYNKLKEARSMKYRPKQHINDDGEYEVKFLRKWAPKYEWQGGPIRVQKPDGSNWDLSVDGVIPNGSKGTAYLDVYDIPSRSSVGTRLVGLKVEEVGELEDFDDPMNESIAF